MASDIIFCARHPSVETLLHCGRCDTPICPKCAVFTDVGARCPSCAPARKLPQLEVSPVWFIRAAAASAVAGAGLGGVWGALLPGGFGFFVIFMGLGLGWAVSEAVSQATNKKLGPVMQGIAAGGVVVAYLVRNVVAGYDIVPTNDLTGLLVVIAGVIMAVNRLKY